MDHHDDPDRHMDDRTADEQLATRAGEPRERFSREHYEEVEAVARLEEIRTEIRAERVSYGQIAELQSLAAHIAPDDVELLEWAGVPEHDDAA